MRHTNNYTTAVIRLTLGIFICISGCVTTSAHKHWLPEVEEATRNSFGGWVEVHAMGEETLCMGELLAVHETELLCLAEDLLTIPKERVSETVVFGYASSHNKLAAWTGLGVLGSVANGWFGILTFPSWLIGGSISTGLQSTHPRIRYDGNEDDWLALRKYARFPQGLPAEISKETLRPR